MIKYLINSVFVLVLLMPLRAEATIGAVERLYIAYEGMLEGAKMGDEERTIQFAKDVMSLVCLTRVSAPILEEDERPPYGIRKASKLDKKLGVLGFMEAAFYMASILVLKTDEGIEFTKTMMAEADKMRREKGPNSRMFGRHIKYANGILYKAIQSIERENPKLLTEFPEAQKIKPDASGSYLDKLRLLLQKSQFYIDMRHLTNSIQQGRLSLLGDFGVKYYLEYFKFLSDSYEVTEVYAGCRTSPKDIDFLDGLGGIAENATLVFSAMPNCEAEQILSSQALKRMKKAELLKAREAWFLINKKEDMQTMVELAENSKDLEALFIEDIRTSGLTLELPISPYLNQFFFKGGNFPRLTVPKRVSARSARLEFYVVVNETVGDLSQIKRSIDQILASLNKRYGGKSLLHVTLDVKLASVMERGLDPSFYSKPVLFNKFFTRGFLQRAGLPSNGSTYAVGPNKPRFSLNCTPTLQRMDEEGKNLSDSIVNVEITFDQQ